MADTTDDSKQPKIIDLDLKKKADADAAAAAAPKLTQAPTIDDHFSKVKPALWLHLAAKAGEGWPDRAEVDEKTYRAAIERAGKVTIGH